MRCCYCDRPLVCDSCNHRYDPQSPSEYEALHQPEYPVWCARCEQIVRCRECGAVYSGSDEEYESE